MIPIAYPQIGQRERTRVEAVLSAGQLADGPEVREFEKAVADRCGAAYGVATANGTAALQASLVALGIGPGDTVVTTPFSFIASANAARFVGADVEFVDIDYATFNIDVVALEQRLKNGSSFDAVIPVHLFGLPADMSALLDLQDKYEFSIVEDAAQAIDASVRGRPVGAIGDVGCFSFYPTKNVTTGEGGMIVTNQEDIAQRARQFTDHGRTDTYTHATVGHNLRLSSIHAAIGNAQLERLEDITATRRSHAEFHTSVLEDHDVVTPVEPDDRTHVYHQYTIRHPQRDRLREELASNEIDTGIYYPIPIHQQPAYSHVSDSFPVSEQASEEVLSIPVHPGLSAADLDHIHQSITASMGALV